MLRRLYVCLHICDCLIIVCLNQFYILDSFGAYCALVTGQPDEATEEHMTFFADKLKGIFAIIQFYFVTLLCIFKPLFFSYGVRHAQGYA